MLVTLQVVKDGQSDALLVKPTKCYDTPDGWLGCSRVSSALPKCVTEFSSHFWISGPTSLTGRTFLVPLPGNPKTSCVPPQCDQCCVLLKTLHTSLVHSDILGADSSLDRDHSISHSITSRCSHTIGIASETLGKEQDKDLRGIRDHIAYVSVDLWPVGNMKRSTDLESASMAVSGRN